MSKWYAKLFCSSLFFISPLHAVVNGDGDYQVWLFNSTKVPLSTKSRLYLENEERWGDQISRLWLTYVQLRYGVNLTKRVEVVFGYRQQWNFIANQWTTTYNPLAELIWSKDIRCWQLWDRTRVQYFIRQNQRNAWLVRNWFKLYLKLNHVSPFLGNEVFFLETQGFSENRTALGAKLNISEKFNCSLYYMFRFIKIETWRDTRVFGTILSLQF